MSRGGHHGFFNEQLQHHHFGPHEDDEKHYACWKYQTLSQEISFAGSDGVEGMKLVTSSLERSFRLPHAGFKPTFTAVVPRCASRTIRYSENILQIPNYKLYLRHLPSTASVSTQNCFFFPDFSRLLDLAEIAEYQGHPAQKSTLSAHQIPMPAELRNYTCLA